MCQCFFYQNVHKTISVLFNLLMGCFKQISLPPKTNADLSKFSGLRKKIRGIKTQTEFLFPSTEINRFESFHQPFLFPHQCWALYINSYSEEHIYRQENCNAGVFKAYFGIFFVKNTTVNCGMLCLFQDGQYGIQSITFYKADQNLTWVLTLLLQKKKP